ncbi:protein transport protein SEC16A homolog [Selaginella moellendorffii]|uniref:protein transport protein SEC16A homolog n=1 Tax=Selaginella moellendorffii TaxID=88036 RepID=UPI000D1C8A3B|nr:protein transport protein SEC16A homolog [Selaginella moellendorffii]XP_024536071.1 protein transport protein SEC16A homolog [Selaginella moellendorffii]XP_024536072.1 protein transport protein SEC16A homolog [Selaginella moellendorffii]XP_024536073.1 protein transport protein SEC16A homolog [Selaginella moellendorffii]|eukprot:XP_024536070.1 protein transport protein SEC16A homolog [Selaginella moellendorffii]
MEPISDNTRRSNMPARSISEPDFRPAQIVSPAKGTPNRGVFTSFVQRVMGFIKTPSKEAKLGDSNKFRYDETLKRWVEEGAEAQAPELPLAPPPTANKLVSRVEENGAPISMSPERRRPTPERPQPVVSGIPPMPPSSNQYAARARQNIRSRYVDTFSKGSITPSKTSSDSPPLFGVVPKASAKPLAAARFFVPAAAAAAAPDINSNHSVDPSSAPAFVPDTAFSNGNGPFAAAAFAQPVVQDMRNDPGPTPDHLSSGSSPAMFYLNHYPAAPLTISLPPPPSSGSHSASDGRAAAAKPTPGKFDSLALPSTVRHSGIRSCQFVRSVWRLLARGGIVNHTPQVSSSGWILVEQCSEVVVVEGGIFLAGVILWSHERS